MSTAPIRIDPVMLRRRLQAAPERYPLFDEQEFSAYLDEHVFAPLRDNGSFELASLDLAAFEMKHVLPANMQGAFENVQRSWARSFSARVKKIAPAAKTTRSFF